MDSLDVTPDRLLLLTMLLLPYWATFTSDGLLKLCETVCKWLYLVIRSSEAMARESVSGSIPLVELMLHCNSTFF